jgi:PBP1b-binding outer membrane lipoprotein LpoB
MVKKYKIIFIISILLLLTGCLSNPIVPDQFCDTSIPVELSDIDYLLYANKMVDALTVSNRVTKLAERSRLNVYVEKLVNYTSKKINSTQIEIAIKNRLKYSAKINLQEDPGKAEFILIGSFNKKYKDCNERVINFSLILKSIGSKNIIWSQDKSYFIKEGI